MLETYMHALDMAAYDAIDSIVAGETETAFLHARDAARYARLMQRLHRRPQLSIA